MRPEFLGERILPTGLCEPIFKRAEIRYLNGGRKFVLWNLWIQDRNALLLNNQSVLVCRSENNIVGHVIWEVCNRTSPFCDVRSNFLNEAKSNLISFRTS